MPGSASSKHGIIDEGVPVEKSKVVEKLTKLVAENDSAEMIVRWIPVLEANPMDEKHKIVFFEDEDGIKWCGWKVYAVKSSRWLNCEIQPTHWLEGLYLPEPTND